MAEGFGSSERLFKDDTEKQLELSSSERSSTTESGICVSGTDKTENAELPSTSAATKDEISDGGSSADTGRSKSSIDTEGSGSSLDRVGEIKLVDIVPLERVHAAEGRVRIELGEASGSQAGLGGAADPPEAGLGAAAAAAAAAADAAEAVVCLAARLPLSAEAVNCALKAAKAARSAALSCLNVMTETLDAGVIGKKQADRALQRAEDAAVAEEIDYYRNVAVNYQEAQEQASRMAYEVEAAAEAAEHAAAGAEAAAAAATEAVNNENVMCYMDLSTEAKNRMSYAYWAANTADMTSIVALKMEFRALKAMRRCWKHIDDAENMGTLRFTWRRRLRAYEDESCGPRRQELGGLISLGVSLTLGILILGGSQLFRKNSDSYYTFIALGSIFLSFFVLLSTYKIVRYFQKRWKAAKISKTRMTIANIEQRLTELKDYFERNNISPVPSDEDEFLDGQ